MNKEVVYFEMLKELNNILKYTDKISMRSFLSSKGLGGNAGTIMVKNEIITATGNNRAMRYVWNSISPTLEMARELQKRTNAYSVECQRKSVKKRISPQVVIENISTPTPKVIKNTIIDYTITKYLFGIVKIKKQYHYKKI